MELNEMVIGQKCYDGDKGYKIEQINESALLCSCISTGKVHIVPFSYAQKNFVKEPTDRIRIYNVHCDGKVNNYTFQELVNFINDGEQFVAEGLIRIVFEELKNKSPLSLFEIKYLVSQRTIQ